MKRAASNKLLCVSFPTDRIPSSDVAVLPVLYGYWLNSATIISRFTFTFVVTYAARGNIYSRRDRARVGIEIFCTGIVDFESVENSLDKVTISRRLNYTEHDLCCTWVGFGEIEDSETQSSQLLLHPL
jgi:hypothetical protein